MTGGTLDFILLSNLNVHLDRFYSYVMHRRLIKRRLISVIFENAAAVLPSSDALVNYRY
jgi:hypothetical protein